MVGDSLCQEAWAEKVVFYVKFAKMVEIIYVSLQTLINDLLFNFQKLQFAVFFFYYVQVSEPSVRVLRMVDRDKKTHGVSI